MDTKKSFSWCGIGDVSQPRLAPGIEANHMWLLKSKGAQVRVFSSFSQLGIMPSQIVAIRLRRSSSPPHSGGLTIVPSGTLFAVQFVSMMALKVLEVAHLLAASSPTLESRPALP
jgi:hypothetical protein